MAGAFQANAFQNNAFQVESAAAALTFECNLLNESSLVSSLQVGSLLQSTLVNQSALTADLPAASAFFAVTLINESSVVAELVKPAVTFSANLLNTSEVTANIVSSSANLSAALINETTLSSNLVTVYHFYSNLLNESSVVSDLIVPGTLQATLLNESNVNASLTLPIHFAADLVNLSEISANLLGPAVLQSNLINESGIVASLVTPIHLSSFLTNTSNLQADFILPINLSANLVNESIVTSDLSLGLNQALLSADLTSNSSIISVLELPKLLQALLSSISSVSADLFTIDNGESGWDAPVVLFTEPQDIKEIALTFDQLGRPLVFYRIGDDQLYLYWFNAKTSQNESKFIGLGKNPVAGFDIVDDTSDSSSDAMIFYVRNDTAFMRIQREDYDVEYNTGVTLPELRLSSAGMRVDNRFQVIYGYGGPKQSVISPSNPGGTPPGGDPDPGIDPNDPGLPGIQPPIDADFVYTNGGMHTGSVMVANTVKVNGNDNFNIGFEIVSHGSGHKMGELHAFYIFGADTWDGFSRNLYGTAYISHQYNYIRFMIWRSSSSLVYTLQMKDTNTLVGKWRFEFVGTTAHMYFNDELKATDTFSNTGPFDGSGRLTFGGVRHIFQNDNNASGDLFASTLSFDGALRNCWIDHPNYGRLDWPLDNFNNEIQPSTPAGHDLKIMNHKSSNWILVPE